MAEPELKQTRKAGQEKARLAQSGYLQRIHPQGAAHDDRYGNNYPQVKYHPLEGAEP
jgi:hypothetical protein